MNDIATKKQQVSSLKFGSDFYFLKIHGQHVFQAPVIIANTRLIALDIKAFRSRSDIFGRTFREMGLKAIH